MLPLLSWLIQGAVGPALVGVPVTWAATDLAGAARRWLRRLRRTDGLSRIVQAATGDDVDLSDAEFAAVRHLLEQESTWAEVGRGTVEELAKLIGSCLPDRPREESLMAGRAIAGGLLEFAIHDLEPEWFKQVLFARLDRLETSQASALDEAMFSLHADLAALLVAQEAAAYYRFAKVMDQLGLVLDRLPPGAAEQRDVTVYLARLVRWLDTDPWPQDAQPAGPALTPAAIERKLRISGDPGRGEQDLDADELARRCTRLVVLGSPGSGKTWLAKRTARLCAQRALEALVAGAGLDEVELPLYITCARLAAAPPDIDIRRAIVAGALGQLPDLGGTQILDAVRALFANRDARTLLVADSLDEARGADDRIRQADTLPARWRIVLTSRSGTWNGQLAISDHDPSRRVGVLQALRYPDDVDAFIAGWFTGRSGWAANLAAQLRGRPDLQQAATVPLILAFYCILGGDQPLPARRAALYARVSRRMLTGRWRGSGNRDPDPDACLETLRDWAWSAAASHPVSGLGEWADEFPTPRITHSQNDQDALDHVAVPLGRADDDTGMTRRRFVHRSIQEHLVAEHLALRMTAEEAAAQLLNHLWFDPDWEYAAPAALAMHPQRGQVLEELIRRITANDQLPVGLAAIDGCREIRRFLARVAQESGEGDWPRKAAELIGQARLDLVTSGYDDLHLAVAGNWPTSNRPILESLLGRLARETDPYRAEKLAGAVAGLDPTAKDQARAREALLGQLVGGTSPGRDWGLADAIAELGSAEEDRARAREALLGQLASEPDGWTAQQLMCAVVQLSVTAEDRARAREALLGLLNRETHPPRARDLAVAVADLDPTAEERARAREALLGLLAGKTNPWTEEALAGAVVLAVTAEDRAQTREALLGLLGRETNPYRARELVTAVVNLDPTAEDRARAREALLGLVGRETHPRPARELVTAVVNLDPTAEDRARAREALLGVLDRLTNPLAAHQLVAARQLVTAVVNLDPTAEDRARARHALLGLLNRETDPAGAQELAEAVAQLAVTEEDRAQTRETLLARLARGTSPGRALGLAKVMAKLDPAADDQARTREALLGQLARGTSPGRDRWLAHAIAELDPAADDQARTRQSLLRRLARVTNSGRAQPLAEAITRLNPTAEDRAQTRKALLSMLGRETDPARAKRLAEAIAGLDPTAEDRAQTRKALLGLLTGKTYPWAAGALAGAVAQLAVTAEDRAQAREALLGLLTGKTYPWAAGALAGAVAQLAVTAEDRAQARKALLGMLGRETDPAQALELVTAVVNLNPMAEDRAQAREALLGLLTGKTYPWAAGALAGALAQLAVTAEDRAQARKALLIMLGRETDPAQALELVTAVVNLNPMAEDRAEAREALLGLIASAADCPTAQELALAVAWLAVTAEDWVQTRDALLARLARVTSPWPAIGLAMVMAELNPMEDGQAPTPESLLRMLARETDRLARETDRPEAQALAAAVTELGPTVPDLGGLNSWLIVITSHSALWAAVRQNSGLSAWLALLPLIGPLAL